MNKQYGPILQPSLNEKQSILGGTNNNKYPIHQIRRYPVFTSHPPLLGVVEASYSTWKKDCCRWRINSNVFAIEYIMSGKFRYTQNGSTYEVGKDSLFLVKHFADNEMLCVSATAEKLAVLLHGSLLSSLQYLPSYLPLNYLKLQSPEGIRSLMERLLDNSLSTTQAAGIGMELLLKIEQEANSSNLPELVQKITEYIDNHLGDTLETKSLCRMFNVSEATMNRCFAAAIKQSPRQYIIGHRMETAKQMLLGSSLPIKKIADKLGYFNQLYFSNDFKRRIGLSPTEFQKKHLL